ncbi:hypothetical protein BHL83_07650 [Limosilactobacillus reuteri]|uniref:Uncharacterized protein n=1 Tax=Limosilactobacillus reuteri TaxID=1598 RepID=A0A1Y3UQJ8_LIMRT|nr:hypothetical protein BHL85_08315 [Limosilactobacillus reuteri]OTA83917.1 hypothetical protein BHL83_07650 [Limosilactobacillus reuteri]OUN48599.1 hypothetical protein B5G22_05325 [Limosilactobacillus reuteri]OUP89588.1 hypothetical protein B5F04_03215 [Limosilactobacillus reuteri]
MLIFLWISGFNRKLVIYLFIFLSTLIFIYNLMELFFISFRKNKYLEWSEIQKLTNLKIVLVLNMLFIIGL